MIRAEVHPKRGEVTLHVDDEGLDALADALDDARPGNKVFLGDPGAMLIVRHVDYSGGEAPKS